MLKSIFEADGNHRAGFVLDALGAIRRHLGMEVAYASEFVGDRAVFRYVDAPGLEDLIKTGESMSLDDIYCRHILDGRLPQLMTNAADFELARQLPLTTAVPIGAHMSVPIRGVDGKVIGMFCCLSRQPDPSLTERDLETLQLFADIAGRQIVSEIQTERRGRRIVHEIDRVIDQSAFGFAYQPIWDFGAGRAVGFEALCRFRPEPYRPPNEWFADAAEAGLGAKLELAVLDAALQSLDSIPAGMYLSLNASPETVLDERLTALLADRPPGRIVLEVTEHAPVANYKALAEALAPLRRAGIGLAIDDAGAGYSSLQHILSLTPDRIKLDASLTRSIEADPARRALASALVFFARETGAALVAEGIETAAEFSALRTLGVQKGQGYYLGRPAPLDRALQDLGETGRLISEPLNEAALSI